jgi:hypothetical protein
MASLLLPPAMHPKRFLTHSKNYGEREEFGVYLRVGEKFLAGFWTFDLISIQEMG